MTLLMTYLFVSYRCKCPSGWSGNRCESDVNECSINNGGCSHNCCNKVGTFQCSCPLGSGFGIFRMTSEVLNILIDYIRFVAELFPILHVLLGFSIF